MKKILKWASIAFVLGVGTLAVVYAFGAIKPARPSLAPAPLAVPVYESSIEVPISIAAARVQELVEASVPSTIRGSSSPNIGGNVDRENLSYAVRRGKISIAAEDGALVLATTVSGSATIKARYCPLGKLGPCTSGQETADLAATVRAVVTDIRLNPDWTLSATLSPTVNVTKAEVRIFGNLIPISLRSEVEKGIRGAMPQVKQAFSDLLNQLDIRREVEAAWAGFDHIAEINESPPVWAVLEPTALRMGRINIDDGDVSGAVGLAAHVKTLFGARPTVPKGAFPTEIAAASSARAVLKVPVMLPLADISRALNECCSPIIVDMGDTEVKLSDITLAEGAGRLIVSVDFRTDQWFGARGTIYLEGKPYLATDKSTLEVRDLDFSVYTRERLLDGAAEILKPILLDALTERLKVDLRPLYAQGLDAAKAYLSDLTVGEGVDVGATVDEIHAEDVLVGDGTLVVVAAATGSIVVKVR